MDKGYYNLHRQQSFGAFNQGFIVVYILIAVQNLGQWNQKLDLPITN